MTDTCFLTGLEAKKLMIRVVANSASGVVFLPDL